MLDKQKYDYIVSAELESDAIRWAELDFARRWWPSSRASTFEANHTNAGQHGPGLGLIKTA
jgi:hypothetical protein